MKLVLALILPSAGYAQSMVKALQLMDLSASEAYEFDDYLHDRAACFDGLNGELKALHVPDKYFMLGSQGARNQFMSVPNIAELNLVRNATLRVFHIGATARAPIVGCVERGECGWLFEHLNTLCHREDGDVGALRHAVSDGQKLISGVVRAVSAFVIPGAESAHRRAATEGGARLVVHPALLLGRGAERDMAILGAASDEPLSMASQALSYVGTMVDDAARMLTGRRLSLWNHPVAPNLAIQAGQFDLKDFFASLAATYPDFDIAAAESVVKRMETEALNYAMKAYADLPMDMKMVAMAAVSDQASRFKVVQYLKRTRLLESSVRKFGVSDDELSALRGYAAGDDTQFDAVADAFVRRGPELSAAERSALVRMMRETAPVLRMNCALLAWMHGRYA